MGGRWSLCFDVFNLVNMCHRQFDLLKKSFATCFSMIWNSILTLSKSTFYLMDRHKWKESFHPGPLLLVTACTTIWEVSLHFSNFKNKICHLLSIRWRIKRGMWFRMDLLPIAYGLTFSTTLFKLRSVNSVELFRNELEVALAAPSSLYPELCSPSIAISTAQPGSVVFRIDMHFL